METKIHDLLLRSFDTELTKAERRRLDEALQNSAQLRLEKERIRLLREAITDQTPRSFSPFFAERVMSRIRRENASSIEVVYGDVLVSAFRPVAVVAFLLILALLSFNALRNDGAVMAGVLHGSGVGIEEAFSPSYALIEE
jgi:hypothetical protein